MRATSITALFASLLLAGGAGAQGLGNLAGGLGGGGLGSMVPGLGSSTAGNAAGLLGYCLKNKLLGGNATGTAGSVLGQLTGRGDVARSPAFQAGQRGQIVGGNGQSFSLAGVKDQIKTKACDMVLQRAQSFVAAR